MLRKLLTLAAPTLALLTLATAAQAHDFWLEPRTWTVREGLPLSVQARIGHAGDSESFAHNPRHFERFELLGRTRSGEPFVQGLVGAPGRHPTGQLRVQQPLDGYGVLVYHSRGSELEMAADDFEDYLREEGLDWVVEERRRLGEAQRPGTERFVRCAKSVLAMEPSAATGFDRRAGLPAELTPLASPGHLEPSSDGTLRMPLIVERKGEPAPGALVEAASLDQPGQSVIARSDDEGVAVFELPQGGRWYFATVLMEREPEASEQDWRSYWANLSLRVDPRE